MGWAREGAAGATSEVLDAARHVLATFARHAGLRRFAIGVAASFAVFFALGVWAEADAPERVVWHFDLSRDRSLAEFFGDLVQDGAEGAAALGP